ncbi:MAG: hypothetical protein PVH64_06290 [Bacillota bacterium]
MRQLPKLRMAASPGWCEGVYRFGRKFALELPAESGNGSRSGRNLPPLAKGSDPNTGSKRRVRRTARVAVGEAGWRQSI